MQPWRESHLFFTCFIRWPEQPIQTCGCTPSRPKGGRLTMRLSDEEQAMRAGEFGEPRRWAIEHQIKVGEFFDAADLVPVSQAHIMADTESLGEAGVRFLEGLAARPEAERRVRVPTLTDPRGLDVAVYKRLGQSE